MFAFGVNNFVPLTCAAVPWKKAGLSVPTAPQKWPQDRKERVSVNSFGVSGSNAHVSLHLQLVLHNLSVRV